MLIRILPWMAAILCSSSFASDHERDCEYHAASLEDLQKERAKLILQISKTPCSKFKPLEVAKQQSAILKKLNSLRSLSDKLLIQLETDRMAMRGKMEAQKAKAGVDYKKGTLLKNEMRMKELCRRIPEEEKKHLEKNKAEDAEMKKYPGRSRWILEGRALREQKLRALKKELAALKEKMEACEKSFIESIKGDVSEVEPLGGGFLGGGYRIGNDASRIVKQGPLYYWNQWKCLKKLQSDIRAEHKNLRGEVKEAVEKKIEECKGK